MRKMGKGFRQAVLAGRKPRHVHRCEQRTPEVDGRHVEVCACGATRVVARGQKPEPWHTCILAPTPRGRV